MELIDRSILKDLTNEIKDAEEIEAIPVEWLIEKSKALIGRDDLGWMTINQLINEWRLENDL